MALSVIETQWRGENREKQLHAAILQTLVYSDIFNFPLTAAEIHRYLISCKVSQAEVSAALNSAGLRRQIISDGEYYALPRRQELFGLRRKRAALAAQLWPQALRIGRIIANLPFVRMVAVTGALVSDNVEPNADLDYLIVTKPGWLWLCRAMVLALGRVLNALGAKVEICPNYLLTERSLSLQDEDLFSAQELTRMVPISGLDIYASMRSLNRWADEFLPNATGAPRELLIGHGQIAWLKRLTETILSALPLSWLEHWEMERKIAKFSRQNKWNDEIRFSADLCKGHFDGHKVQTDRAFKNRLAMLEVGASVSEILFGQSYYLRFDPKLWDMMQPYPPLGTMYAASYLRQHGYDVELFDAMLAESEDEWAAMLDRLRPRFAVIYEDNFNYLSKMCLLRMRQAAFTMIAMAKVRGCTVVVCGSDASDQAAAFLQKGADYVLIGEGEYTLLELMDTLTKRVPTELASILGLAYKENGRVKINTRRADIKNLDELPFPAWDLIDILRYRKAWQERHGFYSMNMVTTRGCPYHCNWCAKPIWGQRYNARSPQNVAAEMKWLEDTYQPDHIWFADDIFGLKPGWLSEFADTMQKERIAVPFKCLNRADLLLREGEIEALKRSGCQITWIGAESGSQKVLDAMEKGTRIEQIYEAARQLHAAGLKVGFFLQFGYPGETMEDIEKTFQMLRDCQPDDIGMSVSYPLPGTKFFQMVKEQMGEKQHWTDSNDLAMMYPGPFSTVFYRQLHVVLHKEFRSRRTLRQLSRGQHVGLKSLLGMPLQAATLFFARRRLRQLGAQPHTGMRPLASALSPEAAAQPTPQA